MRTRELGHLPRRPAHAAADVQDPGSFLDAHAVRQVLLVARDGGVEGLPVGEAAEVERLAPAVLVQVRGQVVVLPRQRRVVGAAGLADRGRLVAGGLVIPVLEVLVYCCFLGRVVFSEERAEAALVGRRVLVEGLFERHAGDVRLGRRLLVL